MSREIKLRLVITHMPGRFRHLYAPKGTLEGIVIALSVRPSVPLRVRCIQIQIQLIAQITEFVCFDSLRPINNLSVKQGRVFLGRTSTKLG